MKHPITLREKYDPAMEITTQADADRYFEECVQHNLAHSTNTREQAEAIERHNIGYWAGYYSHIVRLRVEEFFRCEHPVLGKAKDFEWTADERYGIGVMLGGLTKEDSEHEKDARG